MPWQKGQSGNPGGRPKELRDLAALAREHTSIALMGLVKIALKGKNESARASACQALLDRGYGKPAQTLNANVNILDNLSIDETRALAVALAALTGESGEAGDRPATAH